MTSFWDASAVVPACTTEAASSFSVSLLKDDVPVVWWATRVEVGSALSRLLRTRKITAEKRSSAMEVLQNLTNSWNEIKPGDRLRELAMQNVTRFDLRAADAFQLAAALIWCEEDTNGRCFVCNDLRLSEAARALGFKVLSYYC